MDFEPAARKNIPPAHWGYLATGVDDDATVRANRDGYSHIQIRSRRLVDVTNIDMSRTIFGVKWDSPIVLSPVSAQKAFHPDGELGVARAAKTKGHLMMLSTVATASIEDAIAARGGLVWQQLYPTNVWEVTRAIIKRAEAAGSPAIVLTVDLEDGSNRETLFRSQRVDKRQCATCHRDRKSTRLNSSHSQISYAVFCLKKKKHHHTGRPQQAKIVSPKLEDKGRLTFAS